MKLDYNIKTLEERIQCVNQIIEENWDSIQRYFNNVFLEKKNKLPFNLLLYQLTNYLLYLDNQPTYKERTQYKFEKSVLLFDENKEEYEFRKEIKISNKDIENIPEIKEIQNFIRYLNQSKNPNLKGKKFRWVRDLKNNQIEIKKSKLVSLKQYNKSITPSFNDIYNIDQSFHYLEISDIHNPFNLNLFDWTNWKIVLKVLPFKKQISSNIDRLINIFYECFNICDFNSIQQSIINIYICGVEDLEIRVIRNCDIANLLGIDQNSVYYIVESICRKLYKAYENLFTDYYYTFLVKGKYKKCSKCGKNKIIQDFYDNRNICVDCYNSSEENTH